MFAFLAVLLGCLNCFLLAVIIYILKQPDVGEGRELAELNDIRERVADIQRTMAVFEKKNQSTMRDLASDHSSKLDKVKADMSRMIQEIHDSL